MPTHRRWDVDVEPVLHVEQATWSLSRPTTSRAARSGATRRPTIFSRSTSTPSTRWPGRSTSRARSLATSLAVELLGFELPDWGWAAILPGFGLLPAGELDDPYLKFFDLTQGDTTELVPGVRIPVEPFCGTTGVPGAGMHDVPIPPPHAGGGNIDLRHVTAGATLYLPVGVAGALLSLGDGHAAQGDGEVCVSGLECQMRTTIRVSVERGMTLRSPALRRPPGSLTP